MYNLQKFEIYTDRKQLKREIIEITKKIENKDFLIKNGLIKTVKSISENIAEGHGRFSYQEFTQFCRIARGSAYELIDHLDTTLALGYINKADFDKLEASITRLIIRINNFIAYLQRSKKAR